MEIVKKIALWIAFVLMAIIKLPFTLLGMVASCIEMWLITVLRRVIEEIDNDILKGGCNLAVDFNVAGYECAQKTFEEMKFEE